MPSLRVTARAASTATSVSADSRARSGTTTAGTCARSAEPSGLPCVVLLMTRTHVDFTDLDDAHAAELGPLLLKIHRAVMSVPGVGNVHVGRWGEGSAHCHIWFMARPARMTQMRSSFAAVWDDVLPPTPDDVWRANLDHVRAQLNA